jgi:hypothetical protein
MISTDGGMQIDFSEGQCQNADSPRLEIKQSPAKVTPKIASQKAKHPSAIRSICWLSVTSAADPK